MNGGFPVRLCPRRMRRSHTGEKLLAALLFSLSLAAISCGGGGSSNSSFDPGPPVEMTALDVHDVVVRAATSVSAPLTVAVVNRVGTILAIYQAPGAPATGMGNFGSTPDSRELAVSLARTAAFFSNDQAPLSSRTVRYISGIHFPPGISFTPNAALYGIENTNRGCTLSTSFNPGKTIPPSRSINGTSTSLGIATGKADIVDSNPFAVNPGGVPIFKNGHDVGGVGVVASRLDAAEFSAFTGSINPATGLGPNPAPPGVVVIDGIALPFVNQTTPPSGVGAGTFSDSFFQLGPMASPGPVPDGDLVGPMAGPLGGLSQAEVTHIVTGAVNTASITRAVIRLPLGSRARMVIAVADLDGTIIALHRMPDATIFSIDVAATKARNVIFFSGPTRLPSDLPGVPMGTAVTNRTISFGAQPLFPPGIDGSGLGPFFNLYTFDTGNPCTQGSQAANPNQSGIVFFPGSVPLYRNGVLIGGLGVSGDGVEQDDFVTAGGIVGFDAPTAIRADQISINGVRLPYLKFPRDPTS